MQTTYRGAALVALAVSTASACGPPASPSAPVATAKPTPAEASFAEEPAAELPSPDALGVLRVESLAKLRDAGASPTLRALVWLHEDLTSMAIPHSLASLLLEDRPVDVFWIGDGSLLGPTDVDMFVSAEAPPLDEIARAAHASGEPVSAEAGGRLEIGAEGGPQCLAFVSDTGDPRLLCGGDPASRAEHVGVAQDLSRVALAAGLVVGELSGPALRSAFRARLAAAKLVGARTIAEMVTMELPTLAPAIVPIVPLVVDEGMGWIDDIELARFRIARAGTGTDFEVAIRFDGASSHVAGALAGAAASARPPPSVYWKMPRDAHTTFFSSLDDAEGLESFRAEATQRIGAAAELLDPTLRRLLLDSVVPRQSFAYATGAASTPLPEINRSFVESGRSTISADIIRLEVTARFGWHIFAVDEPIDRYLPYLDSAYEAYKTGPLRQLVYDTFVGLCEGLPAITRRALTSSSLPNGTAAYEMVVPPSMVEKCLRLPPPPAPAKPTRGIILVVPDGSRTWIGLSLEPEDLEKRIAAAIARDGAKGGLADAAELGPLREGTAMLGGHVTAFGLAMAMSNLASFQRGLYTAQHEVREAQQLPNGGLVPILYALEADAGPGSTLKLHVRVPDAAFR